MSPRIERLGDVVDRLRRAGLVVREPDGDAELRGVRDDSRRVEPGDLFCAWAGTAVDAHVFVPAAANAGAAAAIVERPVADAAIPQVVVTDGRRAAALAASAVLGDPGERLTLVGVTGTNGKTTTVWILRHLLSLGHRAASIGTLGVLRTGTEATPGGSLTTPGPVGLAHTLADLAESGVDAVAMEASSHALEQGRVAALRFDAAVFTNLTREHLDYHGSFEAYRDAKRSLAGQLREAGTAVVNADDPAWAGLESEAPKVLRYATAGDAEIRAEDVVYGAEGARFRLVTPAGSADARIPLLGDFNVQNALGAAGACLALGYGLDRIVDGLAEIPQVPGRLERIVSEPCTVLTDFAHTPDALKRALETVRPLAAGRLIVVFGAGGDRDKGKRPLMGQVAAEGADVCIVTSDNPRSEDPDAIIDDILDGMASVDPVRETDRRRAIARALDIARPGDVVLLAGKGHERYQTIGNEKRPFDEREIVRGLLQSGEGAVQ